MESSSQFFCHTCKKDFKIVLLSDDQDIFCPTCNEVFVEQIEDQSQLKALHDLYKVQEQPSTNQSQRRLSVDSNGNEFHDCHENIEEIKNEEQKSEETKSQNQQQQQQQQQPGQPQFFQQTIQTGNGQARITVSSNHGTANIDQNYQNLINEALRGQGISQPINQNGQNGNITVVNSQIGNTDVTIANIEINQPAEGLGEAMEDDGDQEWEDDDEELKEAEAEVQQINIELDLDQDIDLDNLINQQNQQQQQNLQNNPNQNQQQQQFNFGGQQLPFNINNILGNLGGLFGPPGAQPNGVNQMFNIMGGPNNFNIFGNLQSQLDQNILNQVLEQSIHTAMNQNIGIPTSKAFIQKLTEIQGYNLTQKKECHVCQENFVDEDKLYKLPCKHLFHKDCILPWLEKHNTCPLCRFELPTDDIEYENRKRSNPDDPARQFFRPNGGNNGAAGGGNSQPFNSTYHA